MQKIVEETLLEFGLSRNESAIYLFLLSHPNSTTGPIIKQTGIANSRVYESLNSLVSRGIATYSIEADGKHFSGADPLVLKQQLSDRQKNLESALPQLYGLMQSQGKPTVSAIYEGFDGFKTAFEKITTDCPVGGEIDIIGFSEELYAQDSLRIFLKNMNLKSKQRKQKLRILLGEDVRKTLGRDREREKFSQVRYLAPGYISPIAVDIFADYVYFFLWDKQPYVFMMKNEKIAKSMKAYFTFLWGMAKGPKN